LGQRHADGLALAHLEQLDLALAYLLLAAGLYGFRIRLVDPLQAPVGAAQPSRHREGVEQRPASQGVAHELSVLIEDPGEVALAPRHVAQPQDRPSAGRPAVRLHVAASRSLEQRAEQIGRASCRERV
jgi:hypothetical protein